jgi:hypothetical protein
MPNDNVIPFRTRAVALSTCSLPECDDDAAPEDETAGDWTPEDEVPVASRAWSIDVSPSIGGKILIDACLPTAAAMAVVALITELLGPLPATA